MGDERQGRDAFRGFCYTADFSFLFVSGPFCPARLKLGNFLVCQLVGFVLPRLIHLRVSALFAGEPAWFLNGNGRRLSLTSSYTHYNKLIKCCEKSRHHLSRFESSLFPPERSQVKGIIQQSIYDSIQQQVWSDEGFIVYKCGSVFGFCFFFLESDKKTLMEFFFCFVFFHSYFISFMKYVL